MSGLILPKRKLLRPSRRGFLTGLAGVGLATAATPADAGFLLNPYKLQPGAATDPNFANVVLLCGFNGSNGATTFVDESPVARTITRVSTAQISTAQSKFGGSSLLLNGTSDYLTCAHSADFEFGAGQYTVEFFVYFTTVADATFIGQLNGSSSGWQFGRGSGVLVLFADGGAGQIGAAWTPAANTWIHLAVDRDASGATRSYVDGAMFNKATGAGAMGAGTGSLLTIGRQAPSAIRFLAGHMDELRVTKGVARYASDGGFTVPTAAFPRA